MVDIQRYNSFQIIDFPLSHFNFVCLPFIKVDKNFAKDIKDYNYTTDILLFHVKNCSNIIVAVKDCILATQIVVAVLVFILAKRIVMELILV